MCKATKHCSHAVALLRQLQFNCFDIMPYNVLQEIVCWGGGEGIGDNGGTLLLQQSVSLESDMQKRISF